MNIDVTSELHCRHWLAVSKQVLTVNEYPLEAIGERLRADLGDEGKKATLMRATTNSLLDQLKAK